MHKESHTNSQCTMHSVTCRCNAVQGVSPTFLQTPLERMRDLFSTDDGLKDDRNLAVLPQAQETREEELSPQEQGDGRRGFNRQWIAYSHIKILLANSTFRKDGPSFSSPKSG